MTAAVSVEPAIVDDAPPEPPSRRRRALQLRVNPDYPIVAGLLAAVATVQAPYDTISVTSAVATLTVNPPSSIYTNGLKREFFADSMKIGRPVFRRMSEGDPDYVSSDCPIAGRRIMQGIAVDGPTRARKEHPLTLLRMAYGLPD